MGIDPEKTKPLQQQARRVRFKHKKPIASALVALLAVFFLGGSFIHAGTDPSGNISPSQPVIGSEQTLDSQELLAQIPPFSDEGYILVNDGAPLFNDADMDIPYGTEYYGELDSLGRCTQAFALVGPETQSAERRGDIQSVKPSGWKQNLALDGLDHLYERSHLIAYRLTAENDNRSNLVTGTCYMNQGAMSKFEDMVGRYVDQGGHVLMRVTPHFLKDELVCRGVQMEARSLEDDGKSVSFNVFCYNVQPGVTIDYATGESWQD